MMSPQAVADVAYRAGFRGPSLVVAIAVAGAESGYDPTARGDVGLQTAIWGPSIGLWQIRSLNAEKGKGTVRDEVANLNPLTNAHSAYTISGGGSNWRPWSTYVNGAYMRHIEEARVAAYGTESAGGSPASTAGSTPAAPVRTADQLAPVHNFADSPVVAPDFPFVIRGKQIEGSIDDYVVDGRVEMSTDQVWQITLVFEDPAFGLLGSGVLDLDTPVDAGEIHWVVAAVETGQGPAQEQLTVTLRTAGVEKLRQDTGPRTMANVRADAYVQAEAHDVGLILTGGKTDGSFWAQRPTIGRNPRNAADPNSRGESALEAIRRIAGEVGAWVWEGGYSTLYFGQPKRFLATGAGFDVKWRPSADEEALAPVEVPNCRRTNDDPERLAEITVKLPPSRGKQVRPGMRLQLSGVHGFDASYLVTGVGWVLDRGATPVTVVAVTPRDPEPSDPAEAATDPRNLSATPGTRSALDFVAFCLKQAGKRYVYGAEASATDPDPQAFDCSELVEWACSQTGIKFPDGSGNQYAAIAKAGTALPISSAIMVRGALLFRGPGGSDHVAVSLGDGQTTIEARGRQYGVLTVPNVTARGWTVAGLIPGMLYGGQTAETKAEGYVRRWPGPS